MGLENFGGSGGGGGTPGGTPGELQFNNSGSFGGANISYSTVNGDPELTSGTGTLVLNNNVTVEDNLLGPITQTVLSVIDSSANAYNGTQVGTTLTETTGLFGNQLNFPGGNTTLGSQAYVSLPTALFNNQATTSFSFWIKPTTGQGVIFSKQHDGVNSYGVLTLGIAVSGGGAPINTGLGHIQFSTKNAGPKITSAATLTNGTRYYVVIILTPTGARIYINNSLDSSFGGNYTIPNDASPTTVSMGGWVDGAGIDIATELNGSLEEFAIFNTDITSSMSTYYNSGAGASIPNNATGLVALYHFNDPVAYSNGFLSVPKLNVGQLEGNIIAQGPLEAIQYNKSQLIGGSANFLYNDTQQAIVFPNGGAVQYTASPFNISDSALGGGLGGQWDSFGQIVIGDFSADSNSFYIAVNDGSLGVGTANGLANYALDINDEAELGTDIGNSTTGFWKVDNLGNFTGGNILSNQDNNVYIQYQESSGVINQVNIGDVGQLYSGNFVTVYSNGTLSDHTLSYEIGQGNLTLGGTVSSETGQIFINDSAGNININLYGNGNVTAGGVITFSSITASSLVKTNSSSQLVAAVAGVDYLLPSSAISKSVLTSTANSGPSNTATETSLIGTGIGSKTLAANFFAIGTTVRISGGGVYTTPISPGSLVIKVKYGSVILATGTISNLATSATNDGFRYSVLITCRTTGGAGTVMTVGDATYDLTAITKGGIDLNNAGATQTIDTTSSNAIDVTATWSTSTTSTITGTVAAIEVLN